MDMEKLFFLSGFSEDGAYYFMKNTEDRLLVYNVLSSKNFEIEYKSLVSSTPSVIKISKQFPETGIFYLAIGFRNGALLLFNLLTTKLIFSADDVTNEVILELQFHYASDSLILMTSAQRIIKYDLRTLHILFAHLITERAPISSLFFRILKNDNHVIFAAEKKLQLFDLQTKKVFHKFQTSTKPITFLYVPRNSKVALTYSNDIFSLYLTHQQYPVLTLKGLGNHHLKNMFITKTKKKSYFIMAQYTDVIQLWLIDISLKFSQSKVVDSYVMRSESKETINNSSLQKISEIILCLGHHSNPKFVFLKSVIEKNAENQIKLNREYLQEELTKLKWILSEPVKTKDSKKIASQALQINEEQTYVHGDLDLIKDNKKLLQTSSISSLITKELNHISDFNNVVESLSLHLSQSIVSNDQEMIEFCLNSSDDSLIQNTIENLKKPLLEPLLDILVVKTITQPRKSKIFIKWLKALLQIHTSYFIGASNLKEKLGNLKAILLNKTKNQQKLSELRVKINLMKSSYFADKDFELDEKGRRKMVKKGEYHKPLTVYEEGELEVHEEKSERSETEEPRNEFIDVAIPEESEEDVDEEFDRALKANNIEEEQKEEDFIELD